MIEFWAIHNILLLKGKAVGGGGGKRKKVRRKSFGQKPFRLSVYRQPQDKAQRWGIQLED